MKKTRAELDAERLAELESVQLRADSGEDVSDDVADLGIDDDTGNGQPPTERQQSIAPDPTLLAEIETLKRSLSRYEQDAAPAIRRAQDLEREVAELRAQIQTAPAEPEGPLDYGLDEDESEFGVVKGIAEKVAKKLLESQSTKLSKELDSLKRKLSKYEDATNEAEVGIAIAKHRASLVSELGGDNPDEYFNHPRMEAWLERQAEEESLALHNPIVYSAKFVAGILNRFKAEVVRGQAKREPSHGESAVPSRMAPDVISRRDGSFGDEPAFNPATFQSDVQKLISEGKTDRANRLVEIAEKAMSA